jgi:uncharacterized protein YkwD
VAIRQFNPSCVLLIVVAVFHAAVPRANAQTSQQNTTVAEQYLLAAANQERVQRGLSQLVRDPQLADAAARHAHLMAEHAAISHQFADEAPLSDRGASAGVAFSLISENVAQAPSAVEIHDMWMHSEHHRSNLLDPSVDSAGISVVERGGELYAVEDFAKAVRAVSLENQESAIASLVAPPGGIALSNDPQSLSAARATCKMPTGYAGTRRPWFVMRFTSDSLSHLPGELTSRLASGKYREAAVGACSVGRKSDFTSYSFAVLLYP